MQTNKERLYTVYWTTPLPPFRMFLSFRLKNLLQFLRVEKLAGIKDDEVLRFLAYHTVYVLGTDSAQHLWRRLDVTFFNRHHTGDAVYDDAYLVAVYVENDKSAFVIGIFFLSCNLLNVESLVQIDNRNNLPSEIDNSFNIIRCIRNRTNALYFYNFLYIHNINTVQFLSKPERDQLILCAFLIHE